MSTVREITPKVREMPGRALKPFGRMEEFFENLFPRGWMDFEPMAWKRPFFDFERFAPMPPVDMMDRGEFLFVRAEFPGIRPEDLDVTIAGDRLMIEAKREFEEEEKDVTFYRNELALGRMTRTILLPVAIEADKVEAKLVDGILELKLPKVEAIKPHHIKVA